MKDRLEVFCADGASNEFAAGRLAHNDGFPNLLTIMKDKPHASVRLDYPPANIRFQPHLGFWSSGEARQRLRTKAHSLNSSRRKAVLVSMMSDAADVCVSLIRALDTEEYDAASLNWEISSVVQNLHYMFVEGSVVDHGYTKQMLQPLPRQQAFTDAKDRPKCLGGPGTVTAAMLQNCIERLQLFVNLACRLAPSSLL